MKYSIEKITTLIGARRIGEVDAQIGWLLTDSRSLCFPEETLFFALKSARNDGHKYIEDLYRRGVRNFVVEAKGVLEFCTSGTEHMPDANFLIVPSPLAALQRSGSISCCSLRRRLCAHRVAIIPRLVYLCLCGYSTNARRLVSSRQVSVSLVR